MKLILIMLCLGILWTLPAQAAKLHVTGVAPTPNIDGTPLTDLTGIRVEWGSCNADGSFGAYQAGINITGVLPGATFSAWIYPTALNPVCARAFAINSANVLSAVSNTGSTKMPGTLGKPNTL